MRESGVDEVRRGLSRLLVVTPTHNEAAHIERLLDSMRAQRLRPALWIVVDDASTDDTVARLRGRKPEVPFIDIIELDGDSVQSRDRLAAGAAARAFKAGVDHAASGRWDYIAKIDADLELEPDYFASLLQRFAQSPKLGIAGGTLVEPTWRRGWARVRVPAHHVPGAVKLYSAACYESIGGVKPTLGWDTLDEMSARMRGFETRSFSDLIVRHHRRTGAAAGVLRGKSRHGECAWIAHYPLSFAALRSLKVATTWPYLVSGLAFFYGYARAAMTGVPQFDDDQLRDHVHAELRRRVGIRARHSPIDQ